MAAEPQTSIKLRYWAVTPYIQGYQQRARSEAGDKWFTKTIEAQLHERSLRNWEDSTTVSVAEELMKNPNTACMSCKLY